MATAKILILTTTLTGNPIQEANQRNLRTKLQGKGFAFDELDGMEPSNHDVRTELFELSGIKGKFPQIFIVRNDGKKEFVGDYEKFESLLELDELPEDVLAANPDIMTFAKTFAGCELSA